MKEVIIYTDGGCEGNPGPGGWAAILAYKTVVKEISGNAIATTNNRMELTAALEALKTLREPCQVQLFTDSNYLKDGITKWIYGWKARDWKKGKIKNIDLWKALDEARSKHQVTWSWTKGHAGDERNERCDVLAGQEIEMLMKSHSAAVLAEARDAFVLERSRIQGQEEFL